MDRSLNNKISDSNKKNIPFDRWNKWSNKSKDIPFKNNKQSIGDGEEKVAKEYNTCIRGQNSNYDLDIENYKAEIKKLDNDNTFNTGVDGKKYINKLKFNLGLFIICCLDIYNSNLELNENQKNILNIISNLNIDEISRKNINNIKETLDFLYNIKIKLLDKLDNSNTIKLNDPITNDKKDIKIYDAYKILLANNKEINEIIDIISEDNYEIVNQLKLLDHIYIDDKKLFLDELNDMSNLFKDKILIFVDKEKGFYTMTKPNLKVNFERITRGAPRFKVHIQI